MELNGWRGAGLLALGLTCLARGWRYAIALPAELPAGISELSLDGAIIRVLGVLWVSAGIVGIWAAFRLKDLPGVFALAFMHAGWACALLIGWWRAGGDWLGGVTTLGTFALIVCWSRMVNPPRKDPEQLLRTASGGE